MPFTCDIHLQPSQVEHGPLVFDGWIETPWGHYVECGTAFVRAHDGHGSCVIELCGPGVLCDRAKLRPGNFIESGTLFARYQTDGEDIIYDGPVCRVERL